MWQDVLKPPKVGMGKSPQKHPDPVTRSAPVSHNLSKGAKSVRIVQSQDNLYKPPFPNRKQVRTRSDSTLVAAVPRLDVPSSTHRQKMKRLIALKRSGGWYVFGQTKTIIIVIKILWHMTYYLSSTNKKNGHESFRRFSKVFGFS